MNHPGKVKRDLFFKLYIENQKRIFSYILMLVPNVSDAEDILQSTSSIMWDKFDSFTAGSNFGAWAVKIAQFEILNDSRKKKNSQTVFTDEMFDVFAAAAAAKVHEQDRRMIHLRRCIGKLPESDRELLDLRYSKGHTIKEVSVSIGRPLQGLYKVMNRIHNHLLECIQRSMLAEER